MENKTFKKAGIRNLITKNYKLPKDLIDLEALIDDNLSMSENWHNKIKEIVKANLKTEEKIMYKSMW